jgi:hypothetical protein
MVRGDGRRQSKPGGPECTRRTTTRRNGPQALRSSATQPDATKREPSAGTTHSRWSAATRRVGTRSESGIRHGMAPYVSLGHALKVSRSAPHRMPRSETCPDAKTHWRSVAAQSDAGFRASPAVRPPLRTGHGTTRQVAGIRNTKSRKPTPSTKNSARHND